MLPLQGSLSAPRLSWRAAPCLAGAAHPTARAHRSQKPYFGGRKRCQEADNKEEEFDPKHLVCGSCSAAEAGAGLKQCKLHGTEFIEFKVCHTRARTATPSRRSPACLCVPACVPAAVSLLLQHCHLVLLGNDALLR